MLDEFAVGFWGRVAQYGSATVVLLAILILIISWLFRNDHPATVRKIQKYTLFAGLSIPVVALLYLIVCLVGFLIGGLLGFDWF